ncbi:MAG: 50S ribosomal protein L6, partial [Thermodesulfobacteriota bacterium]
MSRIGIQPIDIPDGVKVDLNGSTVKVTGPKGSLELNLREEVSVALDGTVLKVSRRDDESDSVAFHGLMRSLVANKVAGVSTGL